LPGERGLAHLAGDRLLVAVERVLDELLCDRGAALDDPLVADVGDERATDAAQKRRSSIATIACRIESEIWS
jgi:hypothetical protein